MYEIEKGIPAPPARNYYLRYPWDAMAVGDSFFVPDDKRSSVRSAASKRNQLNNGKRFISRAVEGGVRVWRVE